MNTTNIYTPRDAYNNIHERKYFYLKAKGIPHDKATRLATLEAVKYAWIEYTLTKDLPAAKPSNRTFFSSLPHTT